MTVMSLSPDPEEEDEWTMPNWLKWLIGGLAFVGALILTWATGGALTPLLVGMAVDVALGGLIGGIGSAINGGDFWEGFANGSADGAMWGGIFSLASSVFRVIKVARAAKKGIVIGKSDYYTKVAEATQSAFYKGMPGYKIIEKISPKLAEKLGWMHNKAYIQGIMKFKGVIFDVGGELTGTYAKEYALVQGYELLTGIGGFFI